ncbi:putative FAD/NAD(P)-binding domain superfamily [Septoria linicola]|nr:putative FAD/NAD(P)-binding domain superfamily [Septoria linicola]
MGGDLELEFKVLADHTSVCWRLPVEELKAGFMQNLYALQGHRSTWYTGSLWATDFSSNVWAFTDTVLERMVKELQ